MIDPFKVKVSADFEDALRRVGATEKLIKEINSEPEYCGLWWMLSLVPSVLAIGAAIGGLLWLVLA